MKTLEQKLLKEMDFYLDHFPDERFNIVRLLVEYGFEDALKILQKAEGRKIVVQLNSNSVYLDKDSKPENELKWKYER